MGHKPFNQQNRKPNNNQQNKRPPKAPRYKGKRQDPMGDMGRMGQTAVRMFKDMANGRGKPIHEYTEFANYDFLMAALTAVQKKIREEHIILYALERTYMGDGMGTQDIQIDTITNEHRRAYDGWNFVAQILSYMLNTQDTSYVASLLNKLPDYKYVLH